MKYAKSISLGEVVQASDCSHEETRYLNMVCPNCGESVIFRKGTTSFRNGKEVKVQAAWCHRNFKEYHQECKLRNQFITKEEIQERNRSAYYQRLVLIEKSVVEMIFGYSLYLNQNSRSEQSLEKFVKVIISGGKYVTKYCKKPIFFDLTQECVSSLLESQTDFYSLWQQITQSLLKQAKVKNYYQQKDKRLESLTDSIKKFDNPSLATNLKLCREVSTFLLNRSHKSIYITLLSSLISYSAGITADEKITEISLRPQEMKEGQLLEEVGNHYKQKIEEFNPHSAARLLVCQLFYTDWLTAFEWARKKALRRDGSVFRGVGFGSKQ